MRRDTLHRVQIESSNLETQPASEIRVGLAQWRRSCPSGMKYLLLLLGRRLHHQPALLQLSINFRPLKAIRSNHFFDFTFANTS